MWQGNSRPIHKVKLTHLVNHVFSLDIYSLKAQLVLTPVVHPYRHTLATRGTWPIPRLISPTSLESRSRCLATLNLANGNRPKFRLRLCPRYSECLRISLSWGPVVYLTMFKMRLRLGRLKRSPRCVNGPSRTPWFSPKRQVSFPCRNPPDPLD